MSVLDGDIEATVVSAEEIAARTVELAGEIDAAYSDREPVLVGVLKGAAMFMSDLARALERPSTMEFMAVSSYGSGTQSSGVVRILKDLDRDIAGQPRPDRRGHHRLRPHAVVVGASNLKCPAARPPSSSSARSCASPRRSPRIDVEVELRRIRHSPTSSSSATASMCAERYRHAALCRRAYVPTYCRRQGACNVGP